jgi:3-isopropylmalate/(R)-2-methylmalate dehydratase small subunit
MRDNIDTDVIIRIERLTQTPRESLGRYALEALRFDADGAEDSSCVLNQGVFQNAPILLAGRNFGCGSSREGAVWALSGRGIRCVMAESFGDIFFANCFQNGVLPIALPRELLHALATQAASGSAVAVNLADQQVTFPDGFRWRFAVDGFKRAALLAGQDDISHTLQERNRLNAWQAQDRVARPWVWPAPIQHN